MLSSWFFFFLMTQVVPMLNCLRLRAWDIIDALRPLEGKCGFLFSLVSDHTCLVLLKNVDICFLVWSTVYTIILWLWLLYNHIFLSDRIPCQMFCLLEANLNACYWYSGLCWTFNPSSRMQIWKCTVGRTSHCRGETPCQFFIWGLSGNFNYTCTWDMLMLFNEWCFTD